MARLLCTPPAAAQMSPHACTHVIAAYRSNTCMLTHGARAAPCARGSSAGAPPPRDAPHPIPPQPQSLGTSGARGREEGVGWERGGTNNAGKGPGGASPDGASVCL